MKGKLIWSIFWALIVVFLVLIASIPTQMLGGGSFLWVLSTFGGVFVLLGVALIVLTVKRKVGGMPKKFSLLTGSSAVGIPVFAVLHNLVYALLILWFGEDFWARTGIEDEPVFFILATIVCPIGFLVGAVGTIVLAIKNKRGERGENPP